MDVRKKEANAANSKASIALQLPSGRRVQAEFDGTASLWAMLEHFERESKEAITSSTDAKGKVLAPAIVFMNREVRSERICASLTQASLTTLACAA